MKVKGIVTAVIRDAKTGVFKRSFTVENDVTDNQLALMVNAYPKNSTIGRFPRDIFISGESGTVTVPGRRYVSTPLAIGFIEAGVTSPLVINPPLDSGSPVLKTPPYMQYQQRFTPPTVDRTITIIGITGTGATSSDFVSKNRVDAAAWVLLTPTCSQSTTETLDVFYRIQFLYANDFENPADRNPSKTETGLTKNVADKAAHRYNYNEGTQYFFYSQHTLWHGGQNYNNNEIDYAYTREANEYFSNSPQLTSTNYLDLYKVDFQQEYLINNNVGRLIGSHGFGGNGANPTFMHSFRNIIDRDGAGDSPIQGLFGHSAAATKPFYDSTTTQTGLGTLTVDGTGWTNPDWAKMYRIDIITGGATGSATYKLRVRNHFGFDGNAYRDQERSQVFMQRTYPSSRFENFEMGRDDIAWFDYKRLKWNGLAANPTEICIVDISNQTGIRTHVSTHPNFTPTKIGIPFVDTNTDIVWVPCRETGLYTVADPAGLRTVVKITAPTPTGSPVAAVDRCMGVTSTYGNGIAGGRIWAYWSDSVGDESLNTGIGLYWTEDNGVTWTHDTTWSPSFATAYRPENANATPYIVGDPNHVEMRLLVPYMSDLLTGTLYRYRGIWHDVNGTIQGPSSDSTLGYYSSGVGLLANRRVTGTDPRTFGKTVSVSPTGLWGGAIPYSTSPYLYHYYYGATNYINILASPYSDWIVDENGDDALLYSNRTNAIGVYRPDGTTSVETVDVHNFSTTNATILAGYLYLGEGIFFGSAYAGSQTFGVVRPDAAGMVNIASISTVDVPLGHSLTDLNVWTDYGWDGSAWVKDDPNPKTTHSAADALIEGIDITFSDAAGQGGQAGNWIATDYYTFGVADGVWLDGSTEMRHNSTLYFKTATEKLTDVEAGTLPAGTKSVDTQEIWPALTFVKDNETDSPGSGALSIADSGRQLRIGSWVLNSFNKYIQTGELHPATAAGNPAHPKNDVHVGLSFQHYWNNLANQMGYIVGFIPALQVGTTPDTTTTAYGIRIDNPTNGDTSYIDISIVHNGVVQATIPNYQYYYGGVFPENFRIEIKKTGHVVYSVYHTSHGEIILYDSAAGSPVPAPPITTLEDYHVEYVTSGYYYAGYRNLYVYGPSSLDYYLEIGNQGNSTGYWNPDLLTIDYSNFKITINGVAGVDVGNNVNGDDHLGNITPLNAGEYSLFPETGVVRYSPADVGLSVAVEYTEILNN